MSPTPLQTITFSLLKMYKIMHIGGELAMSLLFNFYYTSYTYFHGRMCAHVMSHAQGAWYTRRQEPNPST